MQREITTIAPAGSGLFYPRVSKVDVISGHLAAHRRAQLAVWNLAERLVWRNRYFWSTQCETPTHSPAVFVFEIWNPEASEPDRIRGSENLRLRPAIAIDASRLSPLLHGTRAIITQR